MSDLTAKFNAFEEQIATEHSALLSAIADLQTAIDFVNTQLDTQTLNNAANTRALLGALGQSGACFPCPTPSITVPTVPSTGVTIDTALCQRIQGFLQTMHDILAAMDTLQSYNVVGSFNVLNDAISQVISGIAAGDTVPLPSFPETVNIVGDYISYAGERLFSGIGLVEQFSPITSSLQNAMYAAGSASSAREAYVTTIESDGSISNGARLLFEAVAYNALVSYYFDPASSPDVSGFDGSACSFPSGTCFTLTTHETVITETGYTTQSITDTFGPFTPSDTINTSSGERHNSLPSFYAQNPLGWTYEVLSGSIELVHRTGGLSDGGLLPADPLMHSSDGPQAFPVCGTWWLRGDGATVRICAI